MAALVRSSKYSGIAMATAYHILRQKRPLYHSDKLQAFAKSLPAKECFFFWCLKYYLHIAICQHGVYLRDTMPESNLDGFSRDFK